MFSTLITTKKHTKQKSGELPMVNFTSNTYKMKREFLTFSNKISKNCQSPVFKNLLPFLIQFTETQV